MSAVHLGFYNTASTRTHVRFQFSTHAAAGGNVAPNSAFEAADLRIYKAADGAAFSATQRSSASGITMTSPFDTLTGFHDVDIDLTDNTDSGFYAAGGFYSVVLAPDETVDSQTLTGVVLAYFEIGVAKADVTQFGGTAGTFASGRPEVNTTHAAGTAWGSGAITAASIASDAITDAKVASDVTIASVTGAVGSVTGNVGGNVTGSVGSIATGGIAAASFAAGAIDAAAIAANAIGASELAADAVTEIQSGLSTLDAAGVRTAVGLASANLDTQLGDLPTNAELATSQAAADDATLAAIAALNNLSSAQAQTAAAAALTAYDPPTKAETDAAALTALTTAMTESYSADGAAPTPAQALFAILQRLTEFSISGTAVTVKKLDGSTTAFVLTLDDASTPTASARSS